MLKKIYGLFNFLTSAFRFNFIIPEEQKKFRQTRFGVNSQNHVSENILLVPLMDDFGTMKIVLKLADFIARQENLSIKFFLVHSAIDTNFENVSKLTKLLSKLHSWGSAAPLRRLKNTYGVRSEDIIMSNYFDIKTIPASKDRFSSKQEVLAFKHNDIELGELLYDTFLRFRFKPTVDVNNDELYLIRDYMLALTDKWDSFFKQVNISKVLMPYLAYHHWGLPGRVALKNSVEVITFGSGLYILQKAENDYPYHSKNYTKYRAIFKNLNDKDNCLNIAQKKLDNRLNGVVDSSIAYMQKSAFSQANGRNKIIAFPQSKNWAVIFLHCFFDSPHIYGNGLFVDFYEWTLYILNRASKNPEITYYVKGHPNGVPENKEVLEYFNQKFSPYPNIIFLPRTMSNSLVVANKPGAIFTYYGTVAHEFGYLGVPAITCGKNPHSSYNFVYNTQSIEELDFYIDKVSQYGMPEGYDQKDVLEFYYMHYLYYSPRFDQQGFDMEKNFTVGTINLPENSLFQNLLFS